MTAAQGTASGLVTELTVTTFVFRRDQAPNPAPELQLALIFHQRFGGLLPPCGHWEVGETLDQAALRETREEAGCEIRLLPGPTTPVPAGFPHRPVAGPWMIVEMAAAPDSHTRAPHVHQDHVFVGEWLEDVGEPETEVHWLSRMQVEEFPGLSEDTRLQAKLLFGLVEPYLVGH